MRTACRVTLIITAIALVIIPVIGLVPISAQPLVLDPPPGVTEVDCGTLFSETRWSSDDGCDESILRRMSVAFMALFVAVLSGLVAVGLTLVKAYRRRSEST